MSKSNKHQAGTKNKTFDDLVSSYKPLSFKFLGVRLNEHLPKETPFSGPHLLLLKVKNTFGLPIKYRDVRYLMTSDGKKSADMAYITYFMKERDRGDQNDPEVSKWYYRLLLMRYYPELLHIKPHITKEKGDQYMLRWGYLLDYNPSFEDLIIGTDLGSTLYAIENIY